MKLLNQIERKMGRYYIRGLMKYVIMGMAGVFVLDYLFRGQASMLLMFDRDAIFRGEIWRVLTFSVLPPSSSLIFIIFSLYFYYMIGTSLENQWGSRRFNLFYFIGIFCNIIAGFITGFATNTYLNMSLFLAFAAVYPDFQILLFFFLPIKIKWLALADGVLLLVMFFQGSWAMRLSLVLSLAPYILFFGGQAYNNLRADIRRIKYHWRMRS